MTPARRGVGSHGRDGAWGGDVEGDPTGSHCCSVSSGTVNGSSASTGPRQARVAAGPETNSLLAYTATQVPDDRVTPPGSMLDCLFRAHSHQRLVEVPA